MLEANPALYQMEFDTKDPEKAKDALLCSFRMEDLSDEDLKEISSIKEVVKSYLKMDIWNEPELMKKDVSLAGLNSDMD